MFECPLCNGVAWQPKVTMCCQKVFCGHCLDSLLLNSTACPQCHTSLVVSDGSTGGCSEQRVKKLDRNSTGVQAVLWRVYGNLRVHCENECGWIGNILSYSEHQQRCRLGASQAPSVVDSVLPAQARLDKPPRQVGGLPVRPVSCEAAVVGTPDDMSGNCVVVWEHRATDDTQLTLRVGDRVSVQQVAAHGWVYGKRIAGSQGGPHEGWFPSFCLPERRPPRPQQSPPPSAPPAGSTRVVRDYEASDPAQLSVREGELVYVRQRDQSGWTFVVRVNTQCTGKREGWVPDWLLQGEASGGA